MTSVPPGRIQADTTPVSAAPREMLLKLRAGTNARACPADGGAGADG